MQLARLNWDSDSGCCFRLLGRKSVLGLFPYPFDCVRCRIDVEGARGEIRRDQLFPNPWILQPAEGGTAADDPRVGFVNIWSDDDGVHRTVVYRVNETEIFQMEDWVAETEQGDRVQHSLAARMLQQAGMEDRIPEGTDRHLFRYAGGPGLGFQPLLIEDVFHPRIWNSTYERGAFFKDKIVLIGPIGNFFQDEHATPFERPQKYMPGPEIHLNFVNAAIQQEFLSEWDGAGKVIVWVAAGLVAAFLAWKIERMAIRFAGFVGVTFGYLFLSQVVYDHLNLVVPVAVPLMILNAAGVMVLGYDFVAEKVNRLKLHTTMGYYFTPSVLQEVLENPGAMTAKEANVTLLLTDLRNSTDLAELLGPAGMFDLLNGIFEIQTRAVMAQDGSLEHFLGDQFLSYWGAPKPQPNGPDQALASALELIRELERFKRNLPEETKALFGYGVGLHYGDALVGNKGSEQRLDYGLVGRTINVAARIESLTKLYGVRLIVSGDVLDLMQKKPEHRLLDKVIVKGAAQPVDLFEVFTPDFPTLPSEKCKEYQDAWDVYTQGDFESASEQFEKLAGETGDKASTVLASRCSRLINNPPADWNGIWRMDSKDG